MTIMNPDDMDSNVLGISAFLFIIADLEVSLRNITTNVNGFVDLGESK